MSLKKKSLWSKTLEEVNVYEPLVTSAEKVDHYCFEDFITIFPSFMPRNGHCYNLGSNPLTTIMPSCLDRFHCRLYGIHGS
jgi:hypothetical protein